MQVRALFGNSSNEFLQHLFMKIDANSDGSVSYDEFLSFMLLAQNGATRMENEVPTAAQYRPDPPARAELPLSGVTIQTGGSETDRSAQVLLAT